MKFASTAMLAVALVVLCQVATATVVPVYVAPKASPAASPAPAYIPTYSYCFVQKVAKGNYSALCPPGYTLTAGTNTCTQTAGYKCDSGYTLTVDAFGQAVCKYCKTFYSLNAQGKCALPCKHGYEATVISGVNYCVKSCPAGSISVGTNCVSLTKKYAPAKCTDKCQSGYQMYTVATSSATSGRKLATAAPAPASQPTCQCAWADPCDNYKQSCSEPYLKAATKVTLTTPAVCPNDLMPIDGVCLRQCPNHCTETLDGLCQFPCPTGSYPCKTALLSNICVKGSISYTNAQSVCAAIKKIKLDKSLQCAVPSPAPVPSPIWKPSPPPASPSPKKAKIDAVVGYINNLPSHITGAVTGAVTNAVANKLG